MKREIVLIAHNLRSTHNVGSILRTCDGLGIARVYLAGYTPHPLLTPDDRLPHLAKKISSQIQKTALGAETTQAWEYHRDLGELLAQLRNKGFVIAALEQTTNSVPLPSFSPPEKIALIIGREREGLEEHVLSMVDYAIEIPMLGKKESFNVVQAAAMALYHCRFSKA